MQQYFHRATQLPWLTSPCCLLCILSCVQWQIELIQCTNSPHLSFSIFFIVETGMKRLPLLEHHAPVWMVMDGESDTVTAVGQKHLISFNFQSLPKVFDYISDSMRLHNALCNYLESAITDESMNSYWCGKSDPVVLISTDCGEKRAVEGMPRPWTSKSGEQ